MHTSAQVFSQTLDRTEIPQHLLDLETRVRTNLFPWRGQFSPGLVDILLSTYASAGDIVFDPFAGVGTTLVEAARKQLSCFGTEINPAAVAMGETVMFISLRKQDRKEWLHRAKALLNEKFGRALPLLGYDSPCQSGVTERLSEMARAGALSKYERNIITNVLIRVAEDSECGVDAVHRAFKLHSDIIDNLPYCSHSYGIENTDARQLWLADGTVDFVLTSPPYLNVFNYHQNNRKAMELLGWDLLHVAKSEFGSNRKHRGNRFLTVIQYCLDMQATLIELRRVMKRSGRAIFIVGRESCIRGVAFENGLLVGALANLCGFSMPLRQERKFKNKFGSVIYEDILHLVPSGGQIKEYTEAIALALGELKSRLDPGLRSDVAKDLQAAIDLSGDVKPSPLYTCKAGLRLQVA